MASASASASAAPASPVLRLDATTKTATTALLPLAIAHHISLALPQPISVQWDHDPQHGGASLQPAQPDSQSVNGVEEVSVWLLSEYSRTSIAGGDATQTRQILTRITQALSIPTLPFAEAQAESDRLDQHLALRTFILNQHLSAADLAIWAGIKGSGPLMGLMKKGTHVHLARWYSHLENICRPVLAAFIEAKSVKARSASAVKAEGGATAGNAPMQSKSFDVFLPSAKDGQVVTRFPPEPSGYLHLGHTKAAILNQYFARQYHGKLIVRFDDTNPSKEKAEFQDAIIEDLALLGIKPDQQSFTSDYFDTLYQLIIQLVKQGDAYADDTVQEEMRAQRMDGLPSARRDMSVEETLARFAEMSKGSEEGRKWCLRAKMSIDDPNKALRDPVVYRCNVDTVHHRTGTTWKVYPTYDFACPVVDSLEGVTHALRTNEYRDRNPQFAWFIEKLKLRNVEIWDFGRLNFQYTLLSKRKLTWFVDQGKVTGWDDPRFPTVRGIRRRGMTVEALQQFILATGPSQQVINMEWDQIWTLNKRIIDPVVPRFTAVEGADKVKCTIAGAPPAHEKSVPKHKKNLEIGEKTTVYDPVIYIEQEDAQSFAIDEEVTMMDWGNVYVRNKETDSSSGKVTSIDLEAHFDGDFKKTKKKVHWLSDSDTRPLVPVQLLDFDYLITKPKLEEEDKFEDFVTPVSEFKVDAVADANIADLKRGDKIQFERKGYYILDNDPTSGDGKEVLRQFIKIPDGKVEGAKSKAAAASGAGDGVSPEEKKKKAAEERAAKKALGNPEKKKQKGSVPKGVQDLQQQQQQQQQGPETATGSAKAAEPALSEVEGVDGDGKIKMYKMKRVAEDIPTPVTTSMYSMKPIL